MLCGLMNLNSRTVPAMVMGEYSYIAVEWWANAGPPAQANSPTDNDAVNSLLMYRFA